MIELVQISQQDEPILQNIMQYYFYEFTKYQEKIHLRENGKYDPYPLDKYMEEDNCHAYFLKADNELIGFALVELDKETKVYSIVEFFILHKFKKQGYGRLAAIKIFEKFPGDWEVTQIEKNLPAKAFWRKVIGEFTNGQYEEKEDEYKRTVQTFHS